MLFVPFRVDHWNRRETQSPVARVLEIIHRLAWGRSQRAKAHKHGFAAFCTVPGYATFTPARLFFPAMLRALQGFRRRSKTWWETSPRFADSPYAGLPGETRSARFEESRARHCHSEPNSRRSRFS